MYDALGRLMMSWGISPPPSFNTKLRRYLKPAAVALVLLVCVWFFSRSAATITPKVTRKSTNSRFLSTAASSHPLPKSKAALEFWRSFIDACTKNKPSFEEIKRVSDHSPWIVFNRVKQESSRPELLELPKEQSDELRRLRKQALGDFGHLSAQLPFVRGTRGIVTTAGGDALPILTTSLWMLRASGSTLPVEIWFKDRSEREDEPCDEIFPAFGAQCHFMDDHLPKDLPNPLNLVKFMYKPLAIAFSSFEQVLFLDCDAFPVMNPDSVFETEPFKSTGYVLWPDYWASTASQYFYDLVGRKAPDMKEMATTESGQMLMNKASHSAPILLATWYNLNGPKLWHRLLSQSAPGEGDKDTYLAAAEDYNLPWYQVYERPQRIGYRCDGYNHPVGSAQSHPLDDFKFTSNGVIRDGSNLDLSESFHPRILFVHGNLPKYDPYIILEWKMPELKWEDLLRCNKGEGEAHRMWGAKELTISKYGWDVEHALWDAMRWEACEHETGYSIWIKGSIWRPTEQIRHDLCREMTRFWNELFPGETFISRPPKIGQRVERPWGGWGHPYHPA